jgi:hypothetical protein
MAYLPESLRADFQRFTEGPTKVRLAIGDLDPGTLNRPNKDGWCIRDVLIHLADTELVRAVRFRIMLTEDAPALLPFDEALWKRKLNYLWRSPEAAISLFQQTRFSNGELLRECDLRGWERKATHPDRGEISIAGLVRIGADHVDEHIAQIAELRAARR